MPLCSMLKDIFCKIRWLWALAYLFCTCWFLYQLVQILPSYLHPTLTHTTMEEVPLQSMDFPLDFKLCFEPLKFNQTVLKSFGYEDMYDYASGVFGRNDSSASIGWGGNQSLLEVKNASEILCAVKYDWAMSTVLEDFIIFSELDYLRANVTIQRMNWVASCYLVNMDMVEKNFLSSIV